MGLMKVLDKFRSKNGSAEPGNGGQKMKKVRSIVRVAPKKPVHLPPSKQEPPNYMKSTTSHDKRKGEKNQVAIDSPAPAAIAKSARVSTAARVLVKNSSLKKVRASAKKNAGKSLQSKQGSRDAFPSTKEDSKAPKSVDREKHEAASATACPYSYCSQHGHKHGAVPSLKRILSQKVQKSMDLRGYSSIDKKGGKEIELVEDVVNELFVEIHTKLQEKRSKEGIQIENVIKKSGDQSDAGLLQDSCSFTSSEDCGDKNSELSMDEIQVINQFLEYIKEEFQEETEIEAASYQTRSEFRNDGRRSRRTSYAIGFEKEDRDLQPYVDLPDFKDEVVHPQQLNPESSHGMDRDSEQPFIELNNRAKVKHTRSRSRSSAKRESVKGFNLRPPRLLEQRAEPEQEQVNLKHQSVEERKDAEEWMIDYALRKAMRRLTSVRKKKVPQLVAAFETVLPQKV